MKQSVKVIKNQDETITVRVGRKVEHISTFSKDKAQIFDAVKYALIAQGVVLSDVSITEMLK